MSTPTHRISNAQLSCGGPSRSVLQQLLEEINGDINTREFSGYERSHFVPTVSRLGSISQPQHPQSAVWVNGGSAAEDARKKLRALDEARQRRQSIAGQNSLPAGAGESVPISNIRRRKSPPVFGEVQFGRSATMSFVDPPSPHSHLESMMHGKMERSGQYSSELLPKRLPPGTPYETPSGSRNPSTYEIDNTMLRHGGDLAERTPLSRSPSNGSSKEYSFVRVSSFGPIAEAPPSPSFPSTPRRSFSPMDGMASPAQTPAWMRPFHLVDDEKSIFMNVHGEDWRDHPLCLDCFRLHGNFHRVMRHSCEVCGGHEILKGHYWELPDRD